MTRAQVVIAVEFVLVVVITLMSFHPLALFVAASWPVKLLQVMGVFSVLILSFSAYSSVFERVDRSKTLTSTVKWVIGTVCIMIVLTYWHGEWSISDLRSVEQQPDSLSPTEELWQRDDMQAYVTKSKAAFRSGSREQLCIGPEGIWRVCARLLEPATYDLIEHIEQAGYSSLSFSGLSEKDQQNTIFLPANWTNHLGMVAQWGTSMYPWVYGQVGRAGQGGCYSDEGKFGYINYEWYIKEGTATGKPPHPLDCIASYAALMRADKNNPDACQVGVMGVYDSNNLLAKLYVSFLVNRLTEEFNDHRVSCS